MDALLAFSPILLTILLMTVFNFSAKKALPIAWLLSFVIGFVFWEMSFKTLIACTLYGFLSSLDVIVIIFGAIILMNTLRKSGGMNTINKGFMSISKDSRIQALIIGFLFVSFLEAAAGFGSPAALAAPMLISLGFPAVAAAAITLIFDSVAVSCGAVGTPVIMSLSLLNGAIDANSLASWTVFSNAIAGLLVPFIGIAILTKVFGKEKSLKPAFAAFPFALFTGICFSTCYVIINMLIGFEFASLLGSLISLPIVIFAAKKGFLVPKKLWTFQEGEIDKKDAVITSSPIEDHPIGFIKAWFPYIIIAIILLVTRIDALGLKELLQKSIFVIKFDSLFGYPELSYHFRWAYLPGTVFILVALITHLLHKMNHHQIKEAWTVTIKQVGSATIALLFGVAFVQIMRYSSLNEGGMPSMLMSMANTLAKVGRIAYIVISPFIGVLGSFISGSNTISNVLFTTLQYEVATQIDLFPAAIVSMQINGGAIGNMVCINNAVAVCATLGIVGKEGKLIKTNVIPMILYTLLLIIAVGIGIILFT